jgi:hypothetical protein
MSLLLAAIENTQIERAPAAPFVPEFPDYPWPDDTDAPELSEFAPDDEPEPEPEREPMPVSVPPVPQPKPVQAVRPPVRVTGNTYPVRDQLRAIGGRWNKAARAWEVPADRADEAARIVERAPVRERTKADWLAINIRKRGGTPGVCRSCGSSCKLPFDLCWDCREEGR